MSKQVRIRAIRKKEIDIYGCVLAMLALARQLTPPPPQAETEATDSPPTSKDDPEASDG